MKILFYRYGSICEPDILASFKSYGVTVIEETTEIYQKNLLGSTRADLVNKHILEHSPAFVFSINFFPVIAEICHIHNILYLCWSVDCPVMELFAQPIQYKTNRIFLFDRMQYEYFHPYNPDCIFYLPLASSVDRFDSVTNSISAKDRNTYSSDISFIGSLYSEKNWYKKLTGLPPYIKCYLDGIIDVQLKIYGYNSMEEALSDQMVEELKQVLSDKISFYSYSQLVKDPAKYTIAHLCMGFQVAETERVRTLNTLAKHFKVDLYTGSDTSPLKGVHNHGTIESLKAMPKVFHLSKINLNMTIKSIQSGLPLRILDIMGCGGFLMTNFQSELTDYFEIGRDLEAYSSMEELVDKCAFYLEHDDIRQEIARNGYEKIRQHHTYPHRIAEMLRNATANL